MKLAIIGLGNMGQAILSGVLKAEIIKAKDIIAADKKFAESNFKASDEFSEIIVTADNKRAVREADYVILAVKPQIIKFVLEDIKDFAESKVIISIAAGINTRVLSQYFTADAKIIRVMPNTPALVAEGMSALYYSSSVEADEKAFVEKIFNSFGKTTEVEENDMDAVTGLSGSGPAFVYIFIEALADAGVLRGLTRETALKLAAQTVKGGAEMVLSSGKHPAELKDMVTSPAGTTITGVAELEKSAFRSAVISAVEKAAERSEELGE
ncbi:pyrroline-5-carboxylate reductase [Halanaerobium congolense]|uniref:Pyrroline-5-carboxylate reductase n=1 Tax=Halanaerobium congolense TaxID=54121 RepID=A0A1G6Q0F5_9FIRM|nr:pyrroline-5-carboxylate reductase [Halanaerobium congolense]PXV68297.1 pyrroline-5-carboxylate reductase [Halanaerobium congolense]SDC85404.1 pyrroline-5-carboxylate reductase [Halanaerobium congolense]SDG90277.1 pyrroline-5-carboxylate reductase [Halanaerobium congolense]SDK99186.1 pyrroline-5-carboxylate reductase [Halanaerobium congolense]SDN01777.1 pyrroline-5-carboxylate reductase [Halanaerobium congolense]